MRKPDWFPESSWIRCNHLFLTDLNYLPKVFCFRLDPEWTDIDYEYPYGSYRNTYYRLKP